MKAALHQLSLPGGFWFCVWEVTSGSGDEWLYVGRTRDSSSPNAQSPFFRLSQHLSQDPKGNVLLAGFRRLSRRVVRPAVLRLGQGLLFSAARFNGLHR